MPKIKGHNVMLCLFIIQGHLNVKFLNKKNVFSHRLHIPIIKRNHHCILDVLISVHILGFLIQCVSIWFLQVAKMIMVDAIAFWSPGRYFTLLFACFRVSDLFLYVFCRSPR